MKRIVWLSLIVMCLPVIATAQSFEDDLYYTPKKESPAPEVKKESRTEVRETEPAATHVFVPSGTTVVVRDRKGDVRDVDEYNRRYDSSDNEFLVEGDTLVIQEKDAPDRGEWVHGFNGSEDDYEYATRLIRFRNPRYAIPVSSPLYWDVVYGVNSWDWNVYDDGFYAYAFPTYTNRLWWDWRFGSFGVSWGFPYYSGYWGWGGYYPGYWGWGGYWGYPHYGWYDPWYGHGHVHWASPLYNTRPAVGSRPGYSSRPSASSRPGYSTRPSSSSRPSTGRVVGTRTSSRPGSSSATSRPGVSSSTSRPSNSTTYTRPSTTRPSGSSSVGNRTSTTRRSSSTYNPSESSTRSSSSYNRGGGSSSSRSSSSYGSGRSSSSSRSYTPSRSSSSSRSSSFSSGGSSRSSGSYSGGGSSRSSGGGSSRSGSSRR